MLNPGVLSNEQISINKKKVKKVLEFQSSNSIKKFYVSTSRGSN